MNPTATERIHPPPETTPSGLIRVNWSKTIWLAFQVIFGLAGILIWPSPTAFAVFITLTAIAICEGHSVGMHRLLIHLSITKPKSLEYVLVWLSTQVGSSGPFGWIRPTCPVQPAHKAGFWRSARWQSYCCNDLNYAPEFRIKPQRRNGPVCRFFERTWIVQQLPPGGWSLIAWEMFLRIAVSLIGHGAAGQNTHKNSRQGWRITDLPVHRFSLRGPDLHTSGEDWHSNHHAFPHPARHGKDPGQFRPTYVLKKMLAALGLATDIKSSNNTQARAGLTSHQRATP